jgi:hypothetical protein
MLDADTDSELGSRGLIAPMVLCCDPLAVAIGNRGVGPSINPV